MQDSKMHKLGKTELLTIILEQQKEIENLKGTVKDLAKETKSTATTKKEVGSKVKTLNKSTPNKKNELNIKGSKEPAKKDVKSINTVNSKKSAKSKQNITNEKEKQNTNEKKKNNVNKNKTNNKKVTTKIENTKNKRTTKVKKQSAKKIKDEKPITALVVVNNSIIKFSRIKVLLNRIKNKAFLALRTYRNTLIKYNSNIKKLLLKIKAKANKNILVKKVNKKPNSLKENSKKRKNTKQKAKNKKTKVSVKNLEKELKQINKTKNRLAFIRNFFYASLVVIAIAIITASYLFKILQVNGSSMNPTLSNGELLITSQFFKYQKGDMIAFYYNDKVLIKRVIGLEGDIVFIDDEGNVYVNNEKLEEYYVDKLDYGKSNISFPYVVPNERVFVLGDNRVESIDSRDKSIGCIPTDNIIGKIKLRLFPLKLY